MRLASTLVLLALATAAVAGGPVYRYTDKDGVVHYTDKPPSPDAQPANLPPIQTISPETPLSEVTGGEPAPTPAAADAAFSLKVTAPAADETFRGEDRTVQVSAQADPPLPEGVGLLYLLDGSAQNRVPTRSLSYTLQGVERGEHMISVAAVDASGKEVARSGPVIVHMKPPTSDMAPKPAKPPTPSPVPKPTPR